MSYAGPAIPFMNDPYLPLAQPAFPLLNHAQSLCYLLASGQGRNGKKS